MSLPNTTSVVMRSKELIESSPSPVVVMAIGAPCSGKSLIIDELADFLEPRTRPIDVDKVIKRVSVLKFGHRTLFSRMRMSIDQELRQRIDKREAVLIDSTNSESLERINDIKRFRKYGAKTIGAVFMDTPFDVIAERNVLRESPRKPEDIVLMYDALQAQRPKLAEGFDWILTASQSGISVTPDNSGV